MKDRAVELLKELTEAHSAPGHEGEVRDIFARELKDAGELKCDNNGSIYCETAQAGPRVILEGHMDEVGFRVQNITPNGFIQFITLGGWWTHNLLSQRIEVLTQSGEKILGVVCSKPPHFLPPNERKNVLPVEAMFIDIGATSRRDVLENFGINLGDSMVPVSDFTKMARGDYYMAKAFDNRVGMAGAIQTGQLLDGQSLPNKLILAGATMEEIGLRGAKTLAVATQPDVAIILEGPPADDTPGMSPAESQGRLGGGVQLRLQDPSAMMNPKLAQLCIDTAKAEGIPHQVTIRRSGGTDAGSFHLANEGIPCIVLGTPARYIHSHNAIIDINDYLAMIELSAAIIKRLDQDTVDELTRYI